MGFAGDAFQGDAFQVASASSTPDPRGTVGADAAVRDSVSSAASVVGDVGAGAET
jgi:hypothetical protein